MGSRIDRMGERGSVAQSGGAALAGGAQAEARLLVVEDDPNIVELLSASLRFAGFTVQTAELPPSTLPASPDLILSYST